MRYHFGLKGEVDFSLISSPSFGLLCLGSVHVQVIDCTSSLDLGRIGAADFGNSKSKNSKIFDFLLVCAIWESVLAFLKQAEQGQFHGLIFEQFFGKVTYKPRKLPFPPIGAVGIVV